MITAEEAKEILVRYDLIKIEIDRIDHSIRWNAEHGITSFWHNWEQIKMEKQKNEIVEILNQLGYITEKAPQYDPLFHQIKISW